jgi:hypothetical protein
MLVKFNDRNASMGMAAQLRLIAELLEQGSMTLLSGTMTVSSTHTGEVMIVSDVVLKAENQPKVEPHTKEPVPRQVEIFTGKDDMKQSVFATLYGLAVDDVDYLNFDHDERDQAEEWVKVARDRSKYPLKMRGCLFDVSLKHNATGNNVIVKRVI